MASAIIFAEHRSAFGGAAGGTLFTAGACFVVRLPRVDSAPSAFKHGVAVEDIDHAVRNAMAVDDLDDDLRLYLGPSRNGVLLEVISLVREDDRTELVIHAMPMRAKFRRLLPGE
jgi:hypothetical protein